MYGVVTAYKEETHWDLHVSRELRAPQKEKRGPYGSPRGHSNVVSL